MPLRQRPQAFTLIELLVVVAILVLLISILLPSLGKARDHAKLAACGSNLKQLHIAAIEYQNDYNAFVGYSVGSDRKILLYPYLNQGQSNSDVTGRQVWFCPANDTPLTQCGYGFNTNLNFCKPTAVANPQQTVSLCDGGLLDNGTTLTPSLTTQLNSPSAATTATCLRPNTRHQSNALINAAFFDGHVEPNPLVLPFYPPKNANNQTTWQYNNPTYTTPTSLTYTDGWWDLQ